jgi:hypothetical protein
VGSQAANPTGVPDRQFAQTKIYATAAMAVASAADVAALDTWHALDPGAMLSDGFHLNAGGHVALLEAVQNTIRRSYPSLRPSGPQLCSRSFLPRSYFSRSFLSRCFFAHFRSCFEQTSPRTPCEFPAHFCGFDREKG